jgi:hypothetical protein
MINMWGISLQIRHFHAVMASRIPQGVLQVMHSSEMCR